MGNIFLAIFVAYLLYYIGNIVYDLFLKKEHILVGEDTTETYTLGDIAEQTESKATTVAIDDVENLVTPKSFNSSRNYQESGEEEDKYSPEVLESLKNRFESEETLDSDFGEIEAKKATQKHIDIEAEASNIDEFLQRAEQMESAVEPITHRKQYTSPNIIDIMEQAESMVSVVESRDGFKVYSTI